MPETHDDVPPAMPKESILGGVGRIRGTESD
jgi:hypothetical protein